MEDVKRRAPGAGRKTKDGTVIVYRTNVKLSLDTLTNDVLLDIGGNYSEAIRELARRYIALTTGRAPSVAPVGVPVATASRVRSIAIPASTRKLFPR